MLRLLPFPFSSNLFHSSFSILHFLSLLDAVNKALMKLLTSQILLSFRVERANGIRGTVVVEEGAAAAAGGATTTATGRRRREEMLLAARRRLSSFGLRSR